MSDATEQAEIEAEERYREALRAIVALEPVPFDGFPPDWQEQIAACSECQGWAKNHPIQRGICDAHREPIWAKERHDDGERKAMFSRARIIARGALKET